MKKLLLVGFAIHFILLAGCNELSSTSDSGGSVSGDWLIPKDQVFDGGPGKDGIPALTNPKFTDVSSTNYLKDEDLVIAVKANNEMRIYPHPILDWHEIINDEIGGIKFAITYCPLTGSGIAWNRLLNGQETTFGVSGLLYNSNLMPYDRASNSTWSQMKMLSVNGGLIGQKADIFPIIESSWKTIKQLYPNAKVVTTETGYSRSYGTYPYGDYKTNNDLLIFPVTPDDKRLPRKERVLGVLINDEAKAYRFENNGSNISLRNDNVFGKAIVVVSSRNKNIFTAYQSQLEDGTIVNLTAVQNELPIVMTDSNGNKFDLFGEVIAGSKKGFKLKSITSMIAYWFAWAAFYPNTSIVN
jgi:hypothetical protein